MLRKKRKTGSGRTRGIGSALWVTGLLMALTAPAVLEAQERNRGRGRGGPERGLIRLQGNLMSRGLLGIQLSMRSADTDTQGAEVQGVTSDGPADDAGLREGDIITSLDGHSLLEPLADPDLEERVDSDRSVPSQRLLFLARELEPGDEVVVEYLRDGTTASATVEPRSTWMGLGFRRGPHGGSDGSGPRARPGGQRAGARGGGADARTVGRLCLVPGGRLGDWGDGAARFARYQPGDAETPHWDVTSTPSPAPWSPTRRRTTHWGSRPVT